MASLLSTATKTAHSLATSLLSSAEAKVGTTIPLKVPVKENDPATTFTFGDIKKGKYVIVGVPGAFTAPCNKHVPGYIQSYDKFKERGIDDIYVVSVNDAFVTRAWKENLAPEGTPIHFVADDQGAFVGALGMLFDASTLLGAPRSKRFVAVVEGETITHIAVEAAPADVTATAAEKVLLFL